MLDEIKLHAEIGLLLEEIKTPEKADRQLDGAGTGF